MPKMPKAMQIDTDCRRAGFSSNAAYLFSLIATTRPNATFKGERFIARTREEWSQKSGLSIHQVRRVFEELRGRDVVVCEQHIHGNKTVSFIRTHH